MCKPETRETCTPGSEGNWKGKRRRRQDRGRGHKSNPTMHPASESSWDDLAQLDTWTTKRVLTSREHSQCAQFFMPHPQLLPAQVPVKSITPEQRTPTRADDSVRGSHQTQLNNRSQDHNHYSTLLPSTEDSSHPTPPSCNHPGHTSEHRDCDKVRSLGPESPASGSLCDLALMVPAFPNMKPQDKSQDVPSQEVQKPHQVAQNILSTTVHMKTWLWG